MRINISGHVLLIPCDDLPGEWVGWCPELDIMSQGAGAQHALAMVCEAVKILMDDDICGGERVFHPLRRGDQGQVEDENWETFQAAKHFRGEWESSANVMMDDLRHANQPVLTQLQIDVTTICGIITEMKIWPYSYRTPGKSYEVTLERAEPRTRTATSILPAWVAPSKEAFERDIFLYSGAEVIRGWNPS